MAQVSQKTCSPRLFTHSQLSAEFQFFASPSWATKSAPSVPIYSERLARILRDLFQSAATGLIVAASHHTGSR
jgi:hypothetical protein